MRMRITAGNNENENENEGTRIKLQYQSFVAAGLAKYSSFSGRGTSNKSFG